MKILYKNKFSILIAFVQWIVVNILQLDKFYFVYDIKTNFFYATKILFLISLIIVWCFIFDVVHKVRSGDEFYRRALFIFVVYGIIAESLVALTWPGVWTNDDLWTLVDISKYSTWGAWQHFLTGVYQDVLLQFLPFPGGIILLQNIIISVCVAFSVAKLEDTFKLRVVYSKTVDIIVKLIPFLIPPVLMYQLTGYRIGLHMYLEFVMVVILLCALKEGRKWTIRYATIFCFISTIVTTWRSETFVYIPAIFIIVILFIKKDIITIKKKVYIIFFILTGFIGINKIQTITLGNTDYKLVSIMRPCVELIRNANQAEDAGELSDINKVLDLNIVKEFPEYNGEQLYWSMGDKGCVRSRNSDPNDDYTKEDYKKFLSAFIKLALKYPNIVIAERWNMFITTSGINGMETTSLIVATWLFDDDKPTPAKEYSKADSEHWIAYKPISKELRRTTLYKLGMMSENGVLNSVLYRLVWNAVIPELILLYAWVKSIQKRMWYVFILLTAVFAKLGVIILSEPTGWIAYMLSFFQLGYAFLVYSIIYWYENRRGE